jgi:hypothetical protein
MKKTQELQQNFCTHLFDKKSTEIINSLPYSKQEALARLNIYRNNVFGNFESVLSSIYPAIKRLVGEDYFEKLVLDFCKKYPSRSGNLDDFGSEFPQFLQQTRRKHKLPYLPDTARLELFFHQAYFCKDAVDFDLKKFQKIPPEDFFNLTFKLHPSCFLIASKFPIFSIWQSNVNEKKPKKLSLQQAESALISKALGQVEIIKLSPAEFIFLENVSKEKNLFETYKKILRRTKSDCNIGKILQKFVAAKIINNFKLEKK